MLCVACGVRRHDLGGGVAEGEADAGSLPRAGGKSKVDERPGPGAGEEHDAVGLEVAVHPALAVQLPEAASHLPEYLHARGGWRFHKLVDGERARGDWRMLQLRPPKDAGTRHRKTAGSQDIANHAWMA